MSIIKQLVEQNKDDSQEIFSQHAKKIGLKASRVKSMAFAMKDEQSFDIAFNLDTPTKVRIEYILGEGRPYNVTIPLERFLSFDKIEAEALHKTVQAKGKQYDDAVKIVKAMPKEVKDLIQKMVK